MGLILETPILESEYDISCKPQQASSILGEDGMRAALEGKLLISILAGVTIEQIRVLVDPSTKVIRAMPNTPCKVRIYYRVAPKSLLKISYETKDPGRHDGSIYHPRFP